MLSHRALRSAVAAIGRVDGLGLRAADRVLLVLPLYHPAGFVTAFLPLAAVGAVGVLPAGPDPTAALAAVRVHRVSIVPATPALFHDFAGEPDVERALASVRLMTSGAAPLDPSDFAAIRHLTGQPVWEGYGISESSSVVSTSLMDRVARPGSVGLPLPGLSVRIVGESDDSVDDRDDDGIAAAVGGTGEVGRIEISGPTMFSGYWPDGTGGPDGDGWFVTGDYGYTDDAGNLHLIDRAAETISVAGFKVFPREIEIVLADHPYVAEVAVVGVPAPVGDRMVAVLVARPGTRPTRDDLEEFVASRLPQFKHPSDYAVVDALPRKELGRIDRAATRELYARTAGIDLSAGGSAGLVAVAIPDAAPGPVVDADAEPPDSADAESDAPAPDVTPESAAGLDELGRRLPGRESAAGRGAEDTDEDLFGDEVD
jgi:long-chain acyl-CoA synthetase